MDVSSGGVRTRGLARRVPDAEGRGDGVINKCPRLVASRC